MDENKLSTIIEMVADRFRKRLQRKTNWGRNEVQLELQKAISSVLADLLDETDPSNQEGIQG